MDKVIKPLLATKADYDKIRYPVLATPKLDGIRCLMVDGVAMSRSMKPIPNEFVQQQLKDLHGLDGELMVNGDFNQVQSGIMKRTGEPDFTYHVFDSWDIEELHKEDVGYKERIDLLEWADYCDHHRIQCLTPVQINNEQELDQYLDECLAKGFEGVMIRDPNGKYKFGRSTVNEGIWLKIKRFLDDEGILIDITEKMHNANELEEDELGYAKRSSAKGNLVPTGTAGSLTLRWGGIEFKVGFGPGFTDQDKQEIWDNREDLVENIVTFRYQELSKDGVPRFGKMVGFRHPDDL